LVPKNHDFGFQCSPRSEQPDQSTPQQLAEIGHQKQISTDSPALVSLFRFPVGTPTHVGVKGREFRMNPRQIENRSNLANKVIVRNGLIKTK
jgi:hypothetical protein